MPSPDGVRLQRVRDFTVQIRRPSTGEIVGTGVIVSADGGVATCAHVVEAALGVRPRDAGEMEVGVYFPLAAPQDRQQTAKIVGVFRENDDDVILVKITGTLPLTSNQVAVLGTAESSQGHTFQSYGYRRLDDRLAGWAEGNIQGLVEAPEAGTFVSEPVQLASSQINRGMSGAAVLDKERNLVVGLVSDTWFPDQSTKDRDTAWAVDAKVLSLAPLNVPLRGEPLPLLPALLPRIDVEATRQLAGQGLGVAWNTAPAHLPEWVGRDELLAGLTGDWTETRVHITGLVGFGGEGKSSLARRWVEQVLQGPEAVRADGVFWWGFYDKPDVDDFFDAVLEYVTGRRVDPAKIGSTSAKVQYVGAMLGRGRYVFVLDGMEVMQYHEGDRYGQFKSHLLVEFFGYLAASDAKSFALVTTRTQLHDLASYTTYRERDLTRLSTGDGITMLKAIGVVGPDEVLASLVDEWDGHALTLSLLGAYLVDAHHGDVARAPEMPPPTTDEHRYDRIHRVLRQYDQHLSAADQVVLMVLSLPRLPVSPTVGFGPVVSGWELPDVLRPLAGATRESLLGMVDRLIAYRILRYDDQRELLSAHPLVRAHYRARLRAHGPTASAAVHRMLAEAYAAHAEIDLDGWKHRAENFDDIGSLDELRPAIEAVYHLGMAGDYGAAAVIESRWIDRGLPTSWLSVRLGASEAALDVYLSFFPDRDLARDPVQPVYLNAAGVQLQNLGRLDDALSLFTRALTAGVRDERWPQATVAARNLADAHVLVGKLVAAAEAVDRSLQLREKIEDEAARDSTLDRAQDLALAAWIAAARGDDETATARYGSVLEMVKDLGIPTPLARAGIDYAAYLYRRGDLERGVGVMARCQDFAEKFGRIGEQADCHRFWGVYWAWLASRPNRGDRDELSARARDEFNRAVTTANRSTVNHQIAALAARGTWAARIGDIDLARQDLPVALDRSSAGGFRLRQVEALTGQAWLALAEGRSDAARAAAQSAIDLSRDAEYIWGRWDAEGVLGRLV